MKILTMIGAFFKTIAAGFSAFVSAVTPAGAVCIGVGAAVVVSVGTVMLVKGIKKLANKIKAKKEAAKPSTITEMALTKGREKALTMNEDKYNGSIEKTSFKAFKLPTTKLDKSKKTKKSKSKKNRDEINNIVKELNGFNKSYGKLPGIKDFADRNPAFRKKLYQI